MIPTNPVKFSAVHHRHLELKAVIVDEQGWLRPEKYSSLDEEVSAVRRSVGVCDVSPEGKIDVKGRELEKHLSSLFKGVPKEVGRVRKLLLQSGTDADGEILCCRLSADHVLILTPPANLESVMVTLQQRKGLRAYITDITAGFTALELAGPKSREVLSKLTELDITQKGIPDSSCAETRLAEVYAIVLRYDYKDLLRFTLLVPSDYGEYVWDTLVHTGGEFELRPYGVAAQRMIREKEGDGEID